jgi:hypothetical protein
MIGFLLGIALAAECPVLQDQPESLSVAWVAPVGKHVGGNTRLMVVPTAALRQWVGQEKDPTVGALLHVLGLRKRKSEPHRRYMVTIFDVRADDLCRPVEGAVDGDKIDGMWACPRSAVRSKPHNDGCGYTVDRATRARGLDLFSIRWKAAAPRGFCVLPADRFVAEGAR